MPEPVTPLLQLVRASLAGRYEVLGELGTDNNDAPLFLAREGSTKSLVAVAVTEQPGADIQTEVLRTLGEAVAVQDSNCPECGTKLPDLERFCFHCGADLSGVASAEGTPESAELLAALAAATVGRFEILGRMDRDGSAGTVYFARATSTGRIAALRLRRAEPKDAVLEDFILSQTIAFRKPVSEPSAKTSDSGSSVPRSVTPAALGNVPPPAPGFVRPPAAGVAPPPAPGFVAPETPAYTASAVPAYVPQSAASLMEPARPPARRGWLMPVVGVAALAVVVAGYVVIRDRRPNTDGGAPVTVSPAVAPSPPAVTGGVLPTPPAAANGGVSPNGVGATTTAGTQPNGATASVPLSGRTAADSGTITVAGTLPANARVIADGRVVRGNVLKVLKGIHVMALSAAGYKPVTQKLTVAAGAAVVWTPKLIALNEAPTTAAKPAPALKETGAQSCRSTVHAEDWTKALELCTNEARAGDLNSATSLARLYANGNGTRADPEQAFSWYSTAAEGGDREAELALGYLLRDGKGIKRDAAASANWFRKAAEAGEHNAQLEYGVALEKGEGIARDERSARVWFGKATDGGNFMAARRLARMLERGAGGSKSDLEAAAIYEKAAGFGDAESALTVGKWYRDGHGVAKSREKALEWFKKAVELGNSEASGEVRKLEKK